MSVYDISGNPIFENAGGILTPQTILDGYIYGAGTHYFVEASGNKSIVYSVIPGKTYKVKSGSWCPRFTVGCFTVIPSNNTTPVYYEAHSGESEFSLAVPNNTNIKYIVLWCYTASRDGNDPSVIINQITVTGKTKTTLPITANYLDDSLNKYIDNQNGIKTEFTLCTWNIGHFAMGIHRNTDINESDYVEKLKSYCDMIKSCNPDIISIQEYSAIFANIVNKGINADDVLFDGFENKFIGEQRHFSCNAVFWNGHARDMEQVDYDCNQDAEITHTTLIEAQDYYYVRWNAVLNGRDVLCIATHLAFDTNKPDELQQAQIDELISVCGNAPYVIIFGDFNTSNFNTFKTAGFSMITNNGTNEGYIDNIIIKGMEIIKSISIDGSNELSDHKMVLGTIRIP